MMRILKISVLIMMLAIITPCTSFSGECLQSDEEMYQDMKNDYMSEISGKEYHGEGWSPSMCWRGTDKSLNNKLRDLSIKIIKDIRLKPNQKLEAVQMIYRFKVILDDPDLSDKIEGVLNYHVANGIGGWRAALEMLDKKFDSYNSFRTLYEKQNNIHNKSAMLYMVSKRPKYHDKRWISFFKEQALVEKDKDLRALLIGSVRKFAELSTPQFVDFLVNNNFANDLETLINEEADLGSLEYVFKKFNLKKFPNPKMTKGEIEDYFKWSSPIYHVLRKDLNKVLPDFLLCRLRPQELRLLRNGIFAFHGKNFRSKELQYYYYGEYENVKYFCKEGYCGSRKGRNKIFNENTLSDIDKQNIAAILTAEKIVKGTDYDFKQYIENYDLEKFLTSKADNFTLTSSRIREIYQVVLDWPRRQVWLWDKNGVAGWDLQTGHRFHFAKSALGPIGLSKYKGLVTYQQNGKLVAKPTDGDEILYSANISINSKQHPNQLLNIFSPDGRFIIFCDEGKVHVVDTENWLQKVAGFASVKIWDSSLDNNKFYIRPYAFTKNGKDLILFVKQHEKLGIAVVPFNAPGNGRILDYKYRESGPGQILALAMDENGEYLYIDEGFKRKILGYSVKNIIEGTSLDPPIKYLNPGKEDYRYVKAIFVSNGRLIRTQSNSFGYINIADNNDNAKTKFINSGIPDFDFEAGVYASGKWPGYVVIRRLCF